MDDLETTAFGPIFIVGASRSGTTLVRQILNGHPRIWITGETHYFDDLRPQLETSGSARLTPRDRARCEQYFGRFVHHPRRKARELEQIRADAARLGGSADAYFEAFCRLRARRRKREIWGEKTPRHVFRIDEMVRAYPRARVICLVRDPRAVVASYRDAWQRAHFRRRPNAAARARREKIYLRSKRQYDIVLTALHWNATVRATSDARARVGEERVYVQRYEELVASPEPAVRAVSAWLGVEYHESMLAGVKVVQSSYPDVEGSEGVSAAPVTRWRTTLAPEETEVVQIATARFMRELGYARADVGASALGVARVFAAVPVGGVRAVVANRHRLGRALEFTRRRLAPMLVRRPLGRADELFVRNDAGRADR